MRRLQRDVSLVRRRIAMPTAPPLMLARVRAERAAYAQPDR
jgi:hypothetical protein